MLLDIAVAQLGERPAVNGEVTGSSPAGNILHLTI